MRVLPAILATFTLLSSSASATDWEPLPNEVVAPADNPTTAEKVELGKKLFFDPRLSLTGTVSCNSCHNVMEGGDDGRATSMGVFGRTGPRNAPTVWNAAFQSSQFWDGRAATLEEQAKGPLVAEPEMGMPSHAVVLSRIQSIPGYVREFEAVFDQPQALTIDNVARTVAAFERTLVTPDGAFDRFVSGDSGALTAQQIRGMKLFAETGCVECHSGPALNGWTAESEAEFARFPRYSGRTVIAKYDLLKDRGRFEVTRDEADDHRFKVPTLRNVTLTAPYFHNGAVQQLDEAVRIMAETQLDTALTDSAVADLVAFLSALEGEFPEISLPRLPSMNGATVLQTGIAPTSQPSTGEVR